MNEDGDSEYLTLEVGTTSDVDEVVLAYRVDGELHELTAFSPPVRAHIEKTRD